MKITCLENLSFIYINVFILFMDRHFFVMCIWNKDQPFYPLTTVRYVGDLFNSQDDVENNFKVILTFIAEWLTNNRLFTNCYIRIKSSKYRFWNSNAKYVVVWRPDRFEHRCQIAQLVTHLTRDLGGLDSVPWPNLGTDRLTSTKERAWGDPRSRRSFTEEECDGQTGSNTGSDSSVGRGPD